MACPGQAPLFFQHLLPHILWQSGQERGVHSFWYLNIAQNI
jgi:hypothetical protein